MSTVHANSARDAMSRIETLILTANAGLPMRAIRGQMASAFDLIVHTERMRDGVRRVTEVAEVTGLEEEDNIGIAPLFSYRFLGENPDGSLNGRFEAHASEPRFLSRLDYFGLGDAFLETIGARRAVAP
jgi:pilus assembly protein CpaF